MAETTGWIETNGDAHVNMRLKRVHACLYKHLLWQQLPTALTNRDSSCREQTAVDGKGAWAANTGQNKLFAHKWPYNLVEMMKKKN